MTDYQECKDCPEPGICCHFAVEIGTGIGVWSDVACPYLGDDGRCTTYETRSKVAWCNSPLYAQTLFPFFCVHYKLHHPYLCTIEKAYEMWGLDGEHLKDFRDRINGIALDEFEERYGLRLPPPNSPGTATGACSSDPGVGLASESGPTGTSSSQLRPGSGAFSPAEGEE